MALLGAALPGCNRKEPPPAPPPPPPLTTQGLAFSTWKSATPDLHDRLLLAHAIANGKTEAIVMVATRMGGTPAVAAEIARLGGEVQGRFDDVGYLYARLPIERLLELSALPDVLMAHFDGGAPGGSYALDRAGHSAASMWASLDANELSLTDTLLGVVPMPLSESPSHASHDSTQSDVPLSIGIHRLLQVASSPNVEGPQPRGEDRFPASGQELFALVANRAVEVYGKPIFALAGDGARVDSINGAASARRVLAIAALEGDGGVAAWSSRGPASDGSAKPDLLTADTDRVASLGAEITAAARAENLPSDARHISWALRMGARRLENYQPHDQGFGVIDVPRALDLLRQVKTRKFDLPDILARAPVKTYLARFLAEPGIGQGLYEREGWLVKRPDTRTITLIRQNGPSTPLAYSLQWQGGDGTFKTRQDEVILPFDTPVEVEIEIAPAEVGIHSALLYLIDKTTQLPVHAVMATIVASEQFTAANGYTIHHGKQAFAEQRSRRYFLEVPPNVASLRVNVAATAGQVEMLLGNGGPIGAGLNLPRTPPIVQGEPAVVWVPYPPPGVYELTLLPGSAKAQVDLSASIHYVDSQLDEAPPKNNSTTLWMNNIYAPLQRSSVLTEVGARRVLKDVGGFMGMRSYNITVPADSTTLRVAASPPDGRAKLGLYLYDCATGTCQLWGSDALTKTVEKFLIVPKPRVGLWRVVIDATASGTAYNYTELITNPRFGAGAAEGPDEPRKIGARWNQKVSFKVQAAMPFGYEAVAVMDVIDAQSDPGPNPLRMTTQVFALH
jgi:hypothetical protein